MASLFDKRAMGSFRTTSLGMGTARLGAVWQGRSIRDGVAAVQASVDLGVGLIDTADVYARGLSERIVGRALRGRADAVVMTKVGLIKTPIGVLRASQAGMTPGLGGLRAASAADRCFSNEYVLRSAQACLRRQNRDALDVLLLHEPSAQTLREKSFEDAVMRLQERGDVIDFGASVRDAEAASAAMDLPYVKWLQIPVSANRGSIAARVASHPRKNEVAVLALGVLGDGALLAGNAEDASRPLTRIPALVDGAWQHSGVDGVLLGMSSASHVDENLAALRRYEHTKGSEQ